jgi:hypothetical protein
MSSNARHADRVSPFRACFAGLTIPGERRSVERWPRAAIAHPLRTNAGLDATPVSPAQNPSAKFETQ